MAVRVFCGENTTTDGLVWLKDGVFHRYTTADGLPHRKVWQLCLTRDTGLWFNSDDSLARFHEGEFRSYSTNDGLRTKRSRCLQASPDGFLVVGVEPGMQRYNPATDRFVDFAPMGFPGDWGVNAIEFGPTRELWVGTDKGLYRLKDNQWTQFTTEHWLLKNGILHVHQNRLGDVWVATRTKGLHRFDGQRFHSFDLGLSEGIGTINCLYSDLEKNIYG